MSLGLRMTEAQLAAAQARIAQISTPRRIDIRDAPIPAPILPIAFSEKADQPDHEDTLAGMLRLLRIPQPVREYRAIPNRRFRLDFAWPDLKLGAEVQGGLHSNGRHTRGPALEDEYEKLSLLAVLGWRVLMFSPRAIKAGDAVQWIEWAIKSDGSVPCK